MFDTVFDTVFDEVRAGRVALNAALLSRSSSYRSAGISRVIHETLVRLARREEPWTYDAYAPIEAEMARAISGPRLSVHTIPSIVERPLARLAWEQIALAGLARRNGASCLHGMAFALPLAWRGPSVLTIYDTSFERYPRFFNESNRTYLRAITPRSARKASAVITISEHARSEIVELYRVPAARVHAIPPAAGPEYRPASSAERTRFREERGIERPFILYLGTLEPRKNVSTLIRAFADLWSSGVRTHDLVLAGGAGWKYREPFELIESFGLGGVVRAPGYVPEGEKPLWYSCADVFVFPSLYEGFGLPLLEAMACGTPVVASSASSLPEVVGDAGRLFDPHDDKALAAALAEVLADPERRRDASARGLERSRRFSWDRFVAKTVDVYRGVLGPRGGN